MLKVSLPSEVLVFPRSRKLCLDSRLSSSIPSLHYSLFPSAISLSHCSIDQMFHYQHKSGYISKSLTIGYSFFTVVWVTRCCVKKLMSVSYLICRSVSSCLFVGLTLTSKNLFLLLKISQ